MRPNRNSWHFKLYQWGYPTKRPSRRPTRSQYTLGIIRGLIFGAAGVAVALTLLGLTLTSVLGSIIFVLVLGILLFYWVMLGLLFESPKAVFEGLAWAIAIAWTAYMMTLPGALAWAWIVDALVLAAIVAFESFRVLVRDVIGVLR